MNIFKKISLINRILKLVKDLKKYLNDNKITKEIKEKIENVINAVKDLGNVNPKLKTEIENIIELIKKDLKL